MARPRHRRPAPPHRHRAAGFTLVEVLVALTIMAVLAGLAWRGLDGMVRARDGTQAAVERTARLNTILTQWQQDLAAVHDSGVVPPLAFDSRTLLLTRTLGDGVALVAWSLRDGRWQRWAGPPLTRGNALQENWLAAQQFDGREPGQLTLLDGVVQWQLYYYRGNAWTNAQSSGDLAEAPAAAAPPASGASAPAAPAQLRELLPDGVRLVVDIGGVSLTRDIVLGPNAQ